MLSHLEIHNLAIVEQMNLDFHPGMTVFTGETGAGKSILIGALNIILGGRAQPDLIRPGADQLCINACFDIRHLPGIREWLQEQSLQSDDECFIRRTINAEGRSRAYINGQSIPIGQLRELGDQLLCIHGQHRPQALLSSEHQRDLLDTFAGLVHQRQQVKQRYQDWQKLEKSIKELADLPSQQDKLTLLRYQIEELLQLNCQENELENLEAEYKTLLNAEQVLHTIDKTMTLLDNEDGQDIGAHLNTAIQAIQSIRDFLPAVDSCLEMLDLANIQVQEASHELRHVSQGVQVDPERLALVEQRIQAIHDVARKHKIDPSQLHDYQQNLEQEAQSIEQSQGNLQKLNKQVDQAKKDYFDLAQRLSAARAQAAEVLCEKIQAVMQPLAMPHGQFSIHFKDDKTPSQHGLDQLEFLVSVNPGQPLQALKKVASGGELSRISLAIQVITSEVMPTPTLIFDEVDVGISGKTAEMVGSLIRQLGKHVQVLCVTHLPQVAAQGHHHFKVTKHQGEETTTSEIQVLTDKQKVMELARLLGGVKITPEACAHAQSMLQAVT